MEFDFTSAVIVSAIVLFALYREFTSLSHSKFKDSEAERVRKNNADAKYETSHLNSMTSTQGLTFIESSRDGKKSLVAQSKPSGIGWA